MASVLPAAGASHVTERLVPLWVTRMFSTGADRPRDPEVRLTQWLSRVRRSYASNLFQSHRNVWTRAVTWVTRPPTVRHVGVLPLRSW